MSENQRYFPQYPGKQVEMSKKSKQTKGKSETEKPGTGKTVQLLIPCLVDQLYPEIGIATANILNHFGYQLQYSPEIVCCGQPAFNAGHRSEATKVAEVCLNTLSKSEDIYAVVCPSGSCTAMLRKFYPVLFEDSSKKGQVDKIINKTFELGEFLSREGLLPNSSKQTSEKVCGFHNSCHSYRELRLKSEGKNALESLAECEVREPSVEPACCGFGGLFSVKFESVASGMAKSRIEKFIDAGTKDIVSNDPGCIMHMRNESVRHNLGAEINHFAIPIARALGLSTESFTTSDVSQKH